MPTFRLTTLDALKRHLGIADAGEDAALGQWLAEAEAGIFEYCRPGLLRETVTEYHDGHGRPELVLKRRPVTAITGVWVDASGYYGHGADAFGDDTERALGTHYAPRGGFAEDESNAGMLLALPGANNAFGDSPGVWPAGSGNVKVIYTAGYTRVPKAVELATHQVVTSIRQAAIKGVGSPIAGQSIGAYSYYVLSGTQAGTAGMQLDDARKLLAPFRAEPW